MRLLRAKTRQHSDNPHSNRAMAPWLSNSVRFLCVATLMAGLASRNCLAKQDIDMTQTESGLVTRLADVDAFEACVPANVMCLREEYGRENQGWWSSGAQTRQRVPRRALVFLAVYRSRKCTHTWLIRRIPLWLMFDFALTLQVLSFLKARRS